MTRPLLFALTLALLLPASPAPASPSDSWVYEGRIYDGGPGPAREASVLVEGGRIACVAAPGDCPVPTGTPRVVSTGATLMSGLIDLHVHARPHYAAVFPRGGVTAVRDANNTFALLDEVDATPGAPRVFRSGPMLDGPDSVIAGMSERDGPPGAYPIRSQELLVVRTAAEAEDAVDRLAAAGAHHVKLYETLPLDAFRAAVGRAHRHGLPVMADLGTAMTRGLTRARVDAIEAAQAGVDSLEHASGVALAYRRLGGDPLAGPINEALLDRIARALVDAGTLIVPTAIGLEQMAADAFPTADTYPLAAQLEEQLVGWWRHSHTQGAKDRAGWQRQAAFHRAFLRRFVALGGRLGAGSDVPALPMVVPGDALRHELGLLVGYGLSPVQALQAATGGAARLMRRDDLGELAVGRHADVLLVNGDPTADLGALAHIHAVWQAGRPLHGAAPATAGSRIERIEVASAALGEALTVDVYLPRRL